LGISRSYKRFGLQVQPNNDVSYKEWAPSAKSLTLVSLLLNNGFSSGTLTIGTEMSSGLHKMNMECGT
jgi:1,4-alpha-glucan branching enzyme